MRLTLGRLRLPGVHPTLAEPMHFSSEKCPAPQQAVMLHRCLEPMKLESGHHCPPKSIKRFQRLRREAAASEAPRQEENAPSGKAPGNQRAGGVTGGGGFATSFPPHRREK